MNEQLIAEEMNTICDRRIEGYDRLIALAEEQQAILLTNRHADLQLNLARFDPILIELQQLDRKENSFTQRIKQAQTGGKISNSVDPESVYAESGEPLMDRVNRLRTLTEMNTHLLSNLMNLANFTMGIVSKMASNRSNTGGMGSPSILLDLKV